MLQVPLVNKGLIVKRHNCFIIK